MTTGTHGPRTEQYSFERKTKKPPPLSPLSQLSPQNIQIAPTTPAAPVAPASSATPAVVPPIPPVPAAHKYQTTQTFTSLIHPNLTTTLDTPPEPDQQHTTLYHTNICSLPKNYLTLQTHINNQTTTPDIIFLTETSLNADTNPAAYALEHSTQTYYAQKHKPSISVYYKNNIHITISDTTINNTASIIIQIHKNETKTNTTHTIIDTYRRPSTKKNPDFVAALQNTTTELQTKTPSTPINAIADININHHAPTPHDAFTHLMLENGLRTTITTPNRYNKRYNSRTLIDVILNTLTQTTITSCTISPPISDNLPIYATIHTTPPRPRRTKRKTLSKRRYEKNNRETLKTIKEALKKIEAQDNRQETTTEHLFTHIQQTMQENIEK